MWNNHPVVRPVRLLLTLAIVLGLTAMAADARGLRAQAKASDHTAEAYDQFLLGRHLEAVGQIDAAIAAYELGARLDPASAEIPAELAALYARQNRAHDAITAAETALKNDPENREAHRILGTVYASFGEARREGGRTATDADARYMALAIQHLEQAQASNVPSTDSGLQLTLGRLYLKDRAFDKAIAVLARFVDQEPSWPEGVILLAQAYGGAGRTDDAINLLQDAAQDDPQLAVALGDLLEGERRWKEAAAAFGKAVEGNPRNTELKKRWASAILNSGGSAVDARDLLMDVVAQTPTDARGLYLLSQAQRKLKDEEAAEATARRLLALNPKSLWGPYALAQVFEDRRDYGKVVEVLQPVIETRMAGAVAGEGLELILAHLGFAFQELGQYDRAIATFERARKLGSGDASLDAYVIQAYLAAHRPREAQGLAREARARSPRDLRLAQLEAQALRENGEIDRGISVMQEAIKTHPDDPSAYVGLAQMYIGGERFGQAAEVLEDAAQRFPGDTSIAFQLGAMFDRQKRYADAERAFQTVLAHDPRNAAALNYLGYMLAERGERLEESVEYIRRALEIEPQNGSYLDSLGWAYFKQNKLDLAESNLRRAGEQLKTNSVVQDHVGEVLFRLGRYDEAISAWERALAGDGESIDKAEVQRKIAAAKLKVHRK